MRMRYLLIIVFMICSTQTWTVAAQVSTPANAKAPAPDPTSAAPAAGSPAPAAAPATPATTTAPPKATPTPASAVPAPATAAPTSAPATTAPAPASATPTPASAVPAPASAAPTSAPATAAPASAPAPAASTPLPTAAAPAPANAPANVSEKAPSTEGLVLAQAPIDRYDMESIKRGAKFFSTTCMSCHTLIYLRYDEVAKEAGITYDRMPVNVKNWPFGVKPPDLSLEADVRGVNWIYTYLHSFYSDPARPTGVNNLLVPNTSMSGILVPYQGEQALVQKPIYDLFHQVEWFDLVKLVKQGTMTPEQFDATVADLVNFLAYAAEPFYVEQRRIGWWVLAFLAVFFVMMYFLKREYWKDVKKHKKE